MFRSYFFNVKMFSNIASGSRKTKPVCGRQRNNCETDFHFEFVFIQAMYELVPPLCDKSSANNSFKLVGINNSFKKDGQSAGCS